MPQRVNRYEGQFNPDEKGKKPEREVVLEMDGGPEVTVYDHSYRDPSHFAIAWYGENYKNEPAREEFSRIASFFGDVLEDVYPVPDVEHIHTPDDTTDLRFGVKGFDMWPSVKGSSFGELLNASNPRKYLDSWIKSNPGTPDSMAGSDVFEAAFLLDSYELGYTSHGASQPPFLQMKGERNVTQPDSSQPSKFSEFIVDTSFDGTIRNRDELVEQLDSELDDVLQNGLSRAY